MLELDRRTGEEPEDLPLLLLVGPEREPGHRRAHLLRAVEHLGQPPALLEHVAQRVERGLDDPLRLALQRSARLRSRREHLVGRLGLEREQALVDATQALLPLREDAVDRLGAHRSSILAQPGAHAEPCEQSDGERECGVEPLGARESAIAVGGRGVERAAG